MNERSHRFINTLLAFKTQLRQSIITRSLRNFIINKVRNFSISLSSWINSINLKDKFRSKLIKIRNSPEFAVFSRIYKESTPVMFVIVISEIAAGFLLLNFENVYSLLPGLLLIIPGIMESRGVVVSNLAQRLSTSVHLGIVSWKLGINEEIIQNFIATFILNLLLGFFLSVIAYYSSFITKISNINFWMLITVTTFMASTVGVVLIVLTIFVVLITHRLGFDPDNITIPIVATLGDITTVAFLFITMRFTYFVNRFVHII